MTETQDLIHAWGVETFGSVPPAGIAGRMTREVSELMERLLHVVLRSEGWKPRGDQSMATSMREAVEGALERYQEATANLADLICALESPECSMQLPGSEAHDGADRADIADELADVEIMLRQVSASLNIDLQAEVDRKMRVNRARRWAQLPSGQFQHV